MGHLIRPAEQDEFKTVREFYNSLIDEMVVNSPYDALWRKDIYPDPEMLQNAIDRQEMFVMTLDAEEEKGKDGSESGVRDREGRMIAGAMIVNHGCNESYAKLDWKNHFETDEISVIHALGVHGSYTGKGYAKKMVIYVIDQAEKEGQKAIRLDVLKGNVPAERLYPSCGFEHQGTVTMYYVDTGWTDFELYELVL